MDRKQIIEKQKALGSICQSKTGDAILRKNVFETRVLRTRLSELETEERRWKTNYSFEVREAKKEARTRKIAKHRSFREVAGVAFASNKFKNLLTTTQRIGNHVDGIQEPKEADVVDDKPKEPVQQSIEEGKLTKAKKEQQKTAQNKDESHTASTINITSSDNTKTPLKFSYSLPEKTQHFSSPLFTRRRGDTFTGRSFKTTDLPKKIKSGIFTHGIRGNKVCTRICSPPLLENASLTKLPMLDKRFLELEAVLVPMNQNEEGTSENEEEEDDDDDRESLNGVSWRSGSSMS